MIELSKLKFLGAAALCFALGGCLSEDPNLEGVSLSGGNAIAHNSALQIVNPWPANVHDTDLKTAAGDVPATISPPPLVPAADGGDNATPVAQNED